MHLTKSLCVLLFSNKCQATSPEIYHFGDAVAPMRRIAVVGPSQDDLLVFIHSSVKVVCEPVGFAGHFHRK